MRWKLFMPNRVREIVDLMDPTAWEHCIGSENPADLLTVHPALFIQTKQKISQRCPNNSTGFRRPGPSSENSSPQELHGGVDGGKEWCKQPNVPWKRYLIGDA